MVLAAVFLIAPRTIRVLPLFGQPRAAVERVLGTGHRVVDQGDPHGGVEVVGGVRQETFAYGEVSVIYLDGRAWTVERDFGKVPDLAWSAALTVCGIPAKDVVATPDGGTLTLSSGTIPPSFFVTYTGTKATIPERTLVVRAPRSVAFAPAPIERKAILDALRPDFERGFHGQRVEFVVGTIAVKEGWAFVEATLRAPGGRALDFRRSDFADLKRDGMVGGSSCALLHRVDGRWRRTAVAYFPTDVAWEPWAKQYGAPRSIFPDGGE